MTTISNNTLIKSQSGSKSFVPANPQIIGRLMKGLVVALSIHLSLIHGPTINQATAQEQAGLRDAFDAEFAQKLETIASKCDELGLVEEAAISRQWFVKRKPDRLYFFVPPPSDLLVPAESEEKNVKFWYDNFRKIRSTHAENLFKLATDLANNDQSADAFRLLHEVLHEDPDHAQARAALGYDQQASTGLWLQRNEVIRSRKASSNQKQFGWKKRTYWRVQSPHFSIDCAAEKEVGEELAVNAERWYSVWRQVFFDYWNRGQSVKNWIDGKSSDTGSSHKFEIVLFRDREQYLSDLSSVNGIEISTGYYEGSLKKSFFYVDQDSTDTWQHELTHQWFQETIPTKDGPAEQGHAWILEGIAMFMESMQDSKTFVTIGGIDANRLQYARLRYNRDQFFIPIESVNSMGRKELQDHADVKAIYSQSAGICHYLMIGEHRDRFIEFLKAFYAKRGGEPDLRDFLGELSSLDRSYQAWLFPIDGSLLRDLTPDTQTALSFPKSGVAETELAAIAKCKALQWLELSQNPIDDQAVKHLEGLSQLRQLFLDSTRITDDGVGFLSTLAALEQLDLSATAVTDDGLSDVAKLENLQVLWLAKTEITDAGLAKLAGLKDLKVIDLRVTNVTPQGVEKLKTAIKDLRVFE